MLKNYKSILFLALFFLVIGLIWAFTVNYISDIKRNKTMIISRMTPNLMVEDVNKTIDFYKTLLDFEVVATKPDTGIPEFAILSKDGVELMIQKRESFIGEMPHLCNNAIGGTFALYIDVEDLNQVYERAKKSCEILHEPHDTFYGSKEFICKDINGYTLTFAMFVE